MNSIICVVAVNLLETIVFVLVCPGRYLDWVWILDHNLFKLIVCTLLQNHLPISFRMSVGVKLGSGRRSPSSL